MWTPCRRPADSHPHARLGCGRAERVRTQVRYAQGTGGAAGPRSNPDRAGAFRRRSGARAALRHADVPVRWRSHRLNESNARMAAQYRELTDSRDMLIDAVRRVVPRAELTGDPVSRLPGHASFIFPGVTGEALLVDLDARGIAASSGSACALAVTRFPHAACHGAGTADRQIRPAYDIPPSPHTGGNRAHLHGLGRLLHRADALVHMVSSQRSLRGQRVLLLIGGRFGCVSRRIARLMPVCV